jgi:hypothetical protein
MGWAAVRRFPAGARDFSLLNAAQTGFEAYLASCPMDTDYSPPSRTEVKTAGDIFAPSYVFIARYLI